MPLVSVVIPVYNGEKKIQETIDSILNQTFSDFEIVVINDGSIDSTIEIIEKVSDSRLRLFSYSNTGLAASRNRGLAQASGEFISFIDADDLWTADKLEAQLRALREYPQAAVAYSWTDYINESSQFLHSGRRITATGDVYEKLLVMNFLENGSNPLIRRQALTAVGGFDESLPAAEDWDLWLRLAARYQFVAVQSAQVLYRVSANSMSTNLSRQEAASLQVIERAFSQAPKSLQYLKKHSLAQLYKYLTFKTLEVHPGKQKSIHAAKFLWRCVKYDPAMLRQTRVMLIAVLKIMAMNFTATSVNSGIASNS